MYEVKIPFGQSEWECENTKCRGRWHEGVFVVLCVTVVTKGDWGKTRESRGT
jgi:hypothetical protein